MQRMRFKIMLPLAFIVLSLMVACTQNQKQPANRVSAFSVDELMKKMTLDEKIGQLNLFVPEGDVTGPGGLDMMGSAFLANLKQLVEEKKVSVSTIDNAVRRILEAKEKLGLFSAPYRYCDPERQAKDLMTPENLQFARELKTRLVIKYPSPAIKGAIDGEEVVQLYIHDKVATMTRPVKELKGFAKVLI
jgi:hypothetical protein